jgi:hypothetical protein
VAVDEEVPLATANKTDHKQPRFTIYFLYLVQRKNLYVGIGSLNINL